MIDKRAARPWIVYGSELSPFTLKVLAMFRWKQVPHRFFPREAGFREALAIEIRKRRLVRRRLPLTWPEMTEDDEFPLVPFVFGPDGENLYDSSAIAVWLDNKFSAREPLVPHEDVTLKAAIALIDEYADEWGLYMVHHNRWAVSARTCNAASRLVNEQPPVLRAGRFFIESYFATRQTRRLNYLFSVAPDGFHIPGLPPKRQPPSRPGFPPTHGILERAFSRLLGAIEPIFRSRPFLFGARFTLADASLYGQLAMNLTDPEANELIAAKAPATHGWLTALYEGRFDGYKPHVPLCLHGDLRPLFAEIGRTFVPLMRQNMDAYQRHLAAGTKLFNETGFDAGSGLYDGELDGEPFRHVVKTFQAKVWRALQPLAEREPLRDWLAVPAIPQAKAIIKPQ